MCQRNYFCICFWSHEETSLFFFFPSRNSNSNTNYSCPCWTEVKLQGGRTWQSQTPRSLTLGGQDNAESDSAVGRTTRSLLYSGWALGRSSRLDCKTILCRLLCYNFLFIAIFGTFNVKTPLNKND